MTASGIYEQPTADHACGGSDKRRFIGAPARSESEVTSVTGVVLTVDLGLVSTQRLTTSTLTPLKNVSSNDF